VVTIMMERFPARCLPPNLIGVFLTTLPLISLIPPPVAALPPPNPTNSQPNSPLNSPSNFNLPATTFPGNSSNLVLPTPESTQVVPQRINVGKTGNLGRYTLGSGDIVKIDVFNVPELSGNQTVAPDGTVNITLIGAIKVEGLSIEEASRLLERKLAPFLVRKIVNISLVDPRPLNIAVVGEVQRPGTRLLSYSRSTATGRDAQAASLTRALEVAGGITQQADIANIQVSRLDGSGGRRLLKINLLKLIEQGDVSQDIKILDGDSILVPRMSDVAAIQSPQISNSSFASDTYQIQVAIAGEVNRIGPLVLTYARNASSGTASAISDPQPTVIRAIQAAGGITGRADVRNIQVTRSGFGGQKTTINIDLWKLLDKGDLSQNLRLAEGDTILIPQAANPSPADQQRIALATFSPDKIQVQIIGEVVRGGTLDLRPNTPFTQAITSAGGLTNDADWKAVELYRINPDGTLARRNLVAELNNPPNEDTNPSLRDRDVIVVRPTFGANLTRGATNAVNALSPILLLQNIFRR
jgi:polysaccharide biosynthesis/export protein